MNRNEINTALAAIMTTALETEPATFPESFAYLALGSDMAKYQTIKALLQFAGLATFAGDCITLTEQGRMMAQRCNEFAKRNVTTTATV